MMILIYAVVTEYSFMQSFQVSQLYIHLCSRFKCRNYTFIYAVVSSVATILSEFGNSPDQFRIEF